MRIESLLRIKKGERCRHWMLASMGKMKKEESFENKMQELEKIVSELEKGDLSLEDSLKKFESGIKISKDCSKLLEEAEQRITIILENDGELKEENFSVEE